jgi:hypothetical protein
VLPQYHLIFDEPFTTIMISKNSKEQMSDIYDTLLQNKASHWNNHDDFDDAHY